MAIENELPHYTGDAAHALEAARREIAALRKQVEECEAHNTDLTNQLADLRMWCFEELRAARAAIGRGSPRSDEWHVRAQVLGDLYERLKVGL